LIYDKLKQISPMEQPDTAPLAQDDSASSSRDSSEGDAAAVPFSLMDEVYILT